MSSPKRKRARKEFAFETSQGVDNFLVPPTAVRYNFGALAEASAELKEFMRPNKPSSIDFSRPGATLALTRAILQQHFNLVFDLPRKHLVPTVPSRHQYLKWASGLLGSRISQTSERFALLDVGTGPSAIYALLASRVLPAEWHIFATDVDDEALECARRNISLNDLEGRIELLGRCENDSLVPEKSILLSRKAQLALTVCNPPFYEEGHTPTCRPRPGTEFQLETEGGELGFLRRLAQESLEHANVWFTSLVGIKSDLNKIVRYLHSAEIGASQVVTTELAAGKRTVRWAVAWRTNRVLRSAVRVEEKTEGASKWRSTLAIRLGSNYPRDRDQKPVLENVLQEAVFETGRWSADASKNATKSSALDLIAEDTARVSCVTCVRDRYRGLYAVEIKVQRGVGCLVGGAGEVAARWGERLERLLNGTSEGLSESPPGRESTDTFAE